MAGKKCVEHRKESSAIGAHMSQDGHHFDEDNVSVVASEDRWFQRGVAEVSYIHVIKPSLKHDRGRHTLPAIYHQLVMKHGLGFHRGHVTSSPTLQRQSQRQTAEEGRPITVESYYL